MKDSMNWDAISLQLRRILSEIYRRVHQQLVPRGLADSPPVPGEALPLSEILLRVRRELTAPFGASTVGAAAVGSVVADLLAISETLSRTPDDEYLRTSFDDWCMRGKGDYPARSSVDNAVPPTEDTLIELLTGAWLGLYFLSTPFVHPWERALRIAQGSGGLPGGACLSKAIGDLYRHSRLSGIRNFGRFSAMAEDKTADAAGILVLDIDPLSMSRRLYRPIVDNTDDIRPLSDVLIGISTCYELLQLRLYVEEGLPIKYILPFVAIGAPTTPAAPRGDRRNMWFALASVFPNEGADVHWRFNPRKLGSVVAQEVLVIDHEMTTVPQCVLGHQIGVQGLRLDPMPKASAHRAPLAGNYLAKNLLEMYRRQLQSAKSNHDVLKMEFGHFLTLEPTPASPPSP